MDIGISYTGNEVGIRYPASLAQTRFWLLDALDPGDPALNVAVRWTVLGPVTQAAAEAAMRRIIARHEVLRTALVEVDGSPVQVVRPAPPFTLRHYDLSTRPLPQAEAEADRLGEVEAHTPFVLDRPPLVRAALITLAPGVTRLLLTLHHAVCDGWSIGVIAEEFVATLRGASPLPDLPLQYGDYAEWQQAWLLSPALAEPSAYWTTQLAALPYVRVKPDHEADARGLGTIASLLLPRALTDGMAATAARHGCTAFTVALAALGRVLQSRTGAADIAVGTQVAGRTEVELEGMVGAFINTLVLRLDVSGDPAWETRVERAAATVAGALHHSAMPFELLIRALNPPRMPRRTPLFSVNLIFQRSFVTPDADGEVTLVDMPSHSAGALYDLNFFMVERPDGWRASCEYDSALFDPAIVDAMLAEWRAALEGKAPADLPPPDAVLDQLSTIWLEVLGVSKVAPEDGFFELGGHSLLAARMLARVESVFGRRIGMAALFSDSTLAGLAARLRPREMAGTQTVFAAIGEVADWYDVQEAMGPQHALACQPKASQLVHGIGPVVVLAAGRNALPALRLAQRLHTRGRMVTLALVEPTAPRAGRGWLFRGRSGRAPAARFDGRTLLFHRPSTPANPREAWAKHLRGGIDVIALPSGRWATAVATQLQALAARQRAG